MRVNLDADALYAQSKKPVVWLGLSIATVGLIVCFSWGRRMMTMVTAPLLNKQFKYDDGGSFDLGGWYYSGGYVFPDGTEPAIHLLHVNSLAAGSYNKELRLLTPELSNRNIDPIVAQYCARLISFTVIPSVNGISRGLDEPDAAQTISAGYSTVQRDFYYLALVDTLEKFDGGNMLFPLVKAQVFVDLGNLNGASACVERALQLPRFAEPSSLMGKTADQNAEVLPITDRYYISSRWFESVNFHFLARAVSAYESDQGVRLRAALFRAIAKSAADSGGVEDSPRLRNSLLMLCAGTRISSGGDELSGVEKCMEFQRRVRALTSDTKTNFIRFYGFAITNRTGGSTGAFDRTIDFENTLTIGYGIVFGLVAIIVFAICLSALLLVPEPVFPRFSLPVIGALIGSLGVAMSSDASMHVAPVVRFGPSCVWLLLLLLTFFSTLRSLSLLMGALISIAALVTAYSYFSIEDSNLSFIPILFLIGIIRYFWISKSGPSKSLIWAFLGVGAVFLSVSATYGSVFADRREALDGALFAGVIILIVMLIQSCSVRSTAKQMLKVIPFALFVGVVVLGWLCSDGDAKLSDILGENTETKTSGPNSNDRLLTAAYGADYRTVLGANGNE